jgi:site-specific recombinase XerD
MKTTSREFSNLLSSFLIAYLPRTRGFSSNTVSAYRDAFVLFLRFMTDTKGVKPEKITFNDFTPVDICAFLHWLESVRGCSVNTCNNRLAAIKSFFRYVQTEAPEWIGIASAVLSIPAQKVAQPAISYLSVDAIKLLLEAAQADSLRDLALLSLMYDSGARVQEIADLTVGDVRLEKPSTVKLTGKGRKTRIVPLTAQVAEILSWYKKTLKSAAHGEPLFRNWRGEPIGRAGIAYVLQKHIQSANAASPGIAPSKATPHMLRHSKAMHLLENGVNLIYIRDFLGHNTVITTEVYAKANPEMKRKAIEVSSQKILSGSNYSMSEKEDLLRWLRETI